MNNDEHKVVGTPQKRRPLDVVWRLRSSVMAIQDNAFRIPMNTFESLLAELSLANVEFLVMGGLAVAVAGFARVTEDVDILIQAAPDNARRLIERLKEFSEGAAGELAPEDFLLRGASASPRRLTPISYSDGRSHI